MILIITQIILVVSNILIIVLLARALLSWIIYFGVRYDSALGRFYRFLTNITEPLVAPVRRLLSRFINTGMFDLAPLVTFFIIIIVSRILITILYAIASA